jgi:protein TonB
MSEFLFRFREPLSAANSVILTLLLLLWFGTLAPAPKRPLTNLPPIELTLVEPEVQPPVEPQLARPSPKAEKTAPRIVTQAVIPAMAQAETGNTPVAPSIRPIQTTPLAPPAPAMAAPPAVPVMPPTNSGREAEAVYVGKVRAYLQSIKRYPTGREASLQRPAGTAVIWFIVRRSGDLVDAGIAASSGAMLLDSTALTTVRRGVYPSFPDEAWAGRTQQRFTVELDFVPK